MRILKDLPFFYDSEGKRLPILKRTDFVLSYFQISMMTLNNWRRDKDFPAPLRRGNVLLFDIEAIIEWLKVNTDEYGRSIEKGREEVAP